ncbi:MAG: hypothetical protein LBV80_05935 [Deltaproteobacteria bacterium]|jgi:hypothetical protein|nr:hypothetical protein [Deltaproteobacteria bacterium]
MTTIDGIQASAQVNFTEVTPLNKTNLFAHDDALGVGTTSAGLTSGMPAPLLTSKPDMMKVMAAFEDLIILMSKLAKETQSAERENEVALLAQKVNSLLGSAKEKAEGAQTMRNMAIVSLAISIINAGITIGLSGLSIGGIMKGEVGKLAGDKLMEAIRVFNTSVSSASQAGSSVSSFVNTLGQTESQFAQAKADEMQAQAEEAGMRAQKSQTMQQDMRDLLNKMVELLNSFYAAQDKIAGAASH